jgi:hypothetical protein
MNESGTSTKSKSQAKALLSNKASGLGGDTTGYQMRDQTSTSMQPRSISQQKRGEEGEEEKDLPPRKRVKSKNEMGSGKGFRVERV